MAAFYSLLRVRKEIANSSLRVGKQTISLLISSTVESREVLVLREWEGLSYKQIADVVDIPMGTVMSRLARARKRLQESLASRGNKETSGELLAVGAI